MRIMSSLRGSGDFPMKSSAFTLIELLVVVSIMALMSSMIIMAYEESAEDAVSASAHELQSVLQRARSLAMRHGVMYGVTFHIENSGDGTVLKNGSYLDETSESRGHWYCIVGPDTSDYGYRSTLYPPRASLHAFFTLDEYMKAMQSVQVGPRYKLQPGTRFLALGDVDELYPSTYYDDPSYPRPWFGYYDEVNKTLYPWGAYNRDVDAVLRHPNTGLDYAGNDGEISYDKSLDTNINPSKVWGRIHFDATAPHQAYIDSAVVDSNVKKYYGYTRNFVGPDEHVLASTPSKKQPRPLVNALWADFMILFDATGAAYVTDAHGRVGYLSAVGSGSPYSKSSSTPYGTNSGRHNMGIKHAVDTTGGFYVTICRDVDSEEDIYHEVNPLTGQPAYHKFETKEDAMASITPFIRVFVNQSSGIAELRDNQHPSTQIIADDLLQHEAYPRAEK